MVIQSFLRRAMLALACCGWMVGQVRAGDERDGSFVEPPPYPRTALDEDDLPPRLDEADVHLMPPEEVEDEADDADDPDRPPRLDLDRELSPGGIRPAQEESPLRPREPLRPATPNTAPGGMNTASNMLGPPTLASMGGSGRGRAQLLARGRSTAPSMVGDFFGGIPASPSQLVGTPLGAGALTSNGAAVGGFNILSNSIIVSNGQFFGVPAPGGLSGGPGVVAGPNGSLQAATGLVPTDALGHPLSPALNQPLFAATTTAANISGFSQLPTSVTGCCQQNTFNPASSIYAIRPALSIALPNAGGSGGGLVGRVKIAENTSPMPRDRVFFNYSYFNGVPLLANATTVNRFTPGFEKTFFDRMASFELRVPFATTLSNNIIADGTTSSGAGALGDISLVGKALLYTDDDLALSGGLQLALPTGQDLNVRLSDGTDLVKVKNDTVHLMPFLGALYTPGDRFFTQGFLQVDAPTNGNRVYVNNFGNGLDSAGQVRDVPFLYADIGSGYWLYRNDDAPRLTGFSTTMELHYNRSLQPTHIVNSGIYQIGTSYSNVEVLNVVIGGHLHFNLNSTLTIGYATPFGNAADRMFNGELRAFFNYRFGPQTTRTRTTL